MTLTSVCCIHVAVAEFRLLLHPNTTQDLQEANPGDPAASVELCVTAEAEDGFSLQLSIVVNLNLTGGNAGTTKSILRMHACTVLFLGCLHGAVYPLATILPILVRKNI